MAFALTIVGVAAAGCDAGFDDLRDPAARGLTGDEPGPVFRADAGFVDAGAEVDAGFLAPGEEQRIADGVWEGRSDYRASGQVELVRLDDGQVELRFSDDFSVSRVPGPVVVVSYRDQLGRGIDPSQGDVELAPLTSERGAQTYAVPAAADDRLFAWVYCEPFGIEVARAPLEVR